MHFATNLVLVLVTVVADVVVAVVLVVVVPVVVVVDVLALHVPHTARHTSCNLAPLIS